MIHKSSLQNTQPLTEVVFYTPSESGIPDGIASFPIRFDRILAAVPTPPTENGGPGIMYIFDVAGIDPLTLDFNSYEERDAWVQASVTPHRIIRSWSESIAYRLQFNEDPEDYIDFPGPLKIQ